MGKFWDWVTGKPKKDTRDQLRVDLKADLESYNNALEKSKEQVAKLDATLHEGEAVIPKDDTNGFDDDFKFYPWTPPTEDETETLSTPENKELTRIEWQPAAQPLSDPWEKYREQHDSKHYSNSYNPAKSRHRKNKSR